MNCHIHANIMTMKHLVFFFFLSFTLLILNGQTNAPVSGPLGGNSGVSWNGNFNGSINGTQSVLTIQQSGSTLKGQINAQGYIYNLEGTFSGNQSHGKVTDSGTGGVLDYSATLSGSRVSMTLTFVDQFGQQGQLPLSFERTTVAQPQGMSNGGNNPGSLGGSAGQQEESIQRDPNLIGGWRHTESYTSGEFGMVSEWYLNINADGSYTYGDGKVAGGGDGYSFDSGDGGSRSTGQWKTENSVVYINEGYGWQAYARYYVEGASMMFTFGDGSKQLWERYR